MDKKMKKLISSLLMLLCLTGGMAAQERGINFRHDLKWNEAVELARSEGKLIFVDFYTQWCGPCYNMAKTVFTLPDVGAFYNENFINMKIDCEEETEGTALAKKYQVRSFPTYGFIDPATGELVHRSQSRQEPDRFIQTGRDALTPELRSFYILDKYAAGDRSRKLLTDYINYQASIYKRDDVSRAFIELLSSGATLDEPEVWDLFDKHISGLTPMLRQVSDNYSHFTSIHGKAKVDAKLKKETQNGNIEDIKSLCDFDGKDFNLKMIEINNLVNKKNYDAAAAMIDAMIADPATDTQELIDRLKFIARLSYRSEELPQAWFDKCVGYLRFIAYNNVNRDEPYIHQAYADALEKLIQRRSAVPAELLAEPQHGKKVYDMRPADLKQKPRH